MKQIQSTQAKSQTSIRTEKNFDQDLGFSMIYK